MQKKRSRFSTFNDGMLFVCTVVSDQTDFGAVKNATKSSDLKKKLKLAYEEMSKRDEDVDFAESQGHTLSMKVKTRHHDGVTTQNQIIIGKTLYSLYKLDCDRSKQEDYLYLEEVRKIS